MQKVEESKAAEGAPKAEAPKEEAKEEMKDEDFLQLDLRVGTIVEVWKHPESENLYCEKIDLGEKEPREIASGLQKFVPLQGMAGQVIVMANLKARKLAGFNSNGMVLCTSDAAHTKVQLLRLPEPVPNGTRILALGLEERMKQEPWLPVLNPKKKVYQKCAGGFATNEKGEACWNGRRLTSGGKVIVSEMVSSHIS